jgi:hypothetical protein
MLFFSSFSTLTAPPDCDAGEFTCALYKFNHTSCIPPHHKCDKENDCHDGSDEQNCGEHMNWKKEALTATDAFCRQFFIECDLTFSLSLFS